MIRFVIPAYNERENIPNLLADLGPRASALGARIIFVDDGSTDGTAELIEEHSEVSGATCKWFPGFVGGPTMSEDEVRQHLLNDAVRANVDAIDAIYAGPEMGAETGRGQ